MIIHWPLTVEGEAPAPVHPRPGKNATTHKQVLIVDDDTLVRETIAGMLTGLGYETIQAEGVTEALDILSASTEVGLVMTDLMMPELSGKDLMRAMRGRGDQRPVVLVSGYDEGDGLALEPSEVPEARLNKPFTLADLRATLSRLEHNEGLAQRVSA